MSYARAAKKLQQLRAALYKMFLASEKDPKLKSVLKSKRKDMERALNQINDYLVYAAPGFSGLAQNVTRLRAAMAQLYKHVDANDPKSKELFNRSIERLEDIIEAINVHSQVSKKRRVTKKASTKKSRKRSKTRTRRSRR